MAANELTVETYSVTQATLDDIVNKIEEFVLDNDDIRSLCDQLIAAMEGMTIEALHAVMAADDDHDGSRPYHEARSLLIMKALSQASANMFWPAPANPAK